MRRTVIVSLLLFTGSGCMCGGCFNCPSGYEYPTVDAYMAAEAQTRIGTITPTIDALEKYKSQHGKYPKTLNLVGAVPDLKSTVDHKGKPDRLKTATGPDYRVSEDRTQFALRFGFTQVGASIDAGNPSASRTYLSKDAKWKTDYVNIDDLFDSYGDGTVAEYGIREMKARKERMQPLIDAFEKYREKHGDYPGSLDVLVTDKYLSKLPDLQSNVDHHGQPGRLTNAWGPTYKINPALSEHTLEFGYTHLGTTQMEIPLTKGRAIYFLKTKRWVD